MIAGEYEKAKEELYNLFPELLKIREKEMYSVAGKSLVKKMRKILGKDNCLEWFYSSNTALNDKAPYDLCKEGRKSEISDLIGRIEHGIIS